MSERPRHSDGIEVNVVDDGFVVYDPRRDRVHHLNETAAVVFEFCTGEIGTDEMAGLLQAAYGLADPPEQELRACLSALREEGLVV